MVKKMNSEILSIGTITRIAELENENKELKETIAKVIDDANELMKENTKLKEKINRMQEILEILDEYEG